MISSKEVEHHKAAFLTEYKELCKKYNGMIVMDESRFVKECAAFHVVFFSTRQNREETLDEIIFEALIEPPLEL